MKSLYLAAVIIATSTNALQETRGGHSSKERRETTTVKLPSRSHHQSHVSLLNDASHLDGVEFRVRRVTLVGIGKRGVVS